MKIGIDCRMFSSAFTGIGRYTHELVDQLIKINNQKNRAHEIVLFFNNPEYRSYTPPNPSIKKILVNAKHYSFAEQTKFLKILNKENCDIVHFPHFNIPILYRKPYIVTIHDLTLSFFPGKKLNRFYHRLAYNITIKNAVKTARKVISVSENTKQDIVSHLHIPEEKIEVIYHGIGPEFKVITENKIFQKTLKKYNIHKEFLLYTGVWRDHKNLPRLIEALNILKNTKNLNLNLVITGKPDPNYPEIKEAVKIHHLEEDVIFTGRISDEELIHLYNAAHIYVFPSLYEGFGLPPLEAMKCATPVAASNTSSIPEICGENNAQFFNPYDIEDIADKIYELHTDIDLQADYIENGKIHAEKFTWERMGEKTYNVIRRAVK